MAMLDKKGRILDDLHALEWLGLSSGIVALGSFTNNGTIRITAAALALTVALQSRDRIVGTQRGLVGLVGEHFDGGSVEPRKAKGARQLRASITGVVKIHDIIHVLEGEPLVLGEEVERTEWGRATDDSLVTTELLHAVDV